MFVIFERDVIKSSVKYTPRNLQSNISERAALKVPGGKLRAEKLRDEMIPCREVRVQICATLSYEWPKRAPRA